MLTQNGVKFISVSIVESSTNATCQAVAGSLFWRCSGISASVNMLTLECEIAASQQQRYQRNTSIILLLPKPMKLTIFTTVILSVFYLVYIGIVLTHLLHTFWKYDIPENHLFTLKPLLEFGANSSFRGVAFIWEILHLPSHWFSSLLIGHVV